MDVKILRSTVTGTSEEGTTLGQIGEAINNISRRRWRKPV
jgi:hypothetical protein